MAKINSKRQTVGNILMGIWVLFACLAQTSVFPYFKIFDSVPQLVLVTLAVFAAFSNRTLICCYAVVGGFIMGCLSAEPIMLYPVTYLLAVCVSMAVTEIMTFLPLLASLVAVAVACICDGIMSCGLILYRFENASVLDGIVYSLLPSLFYSLLIFLPVYFLSHLHKLLFTAGDKA